MFGLVPPPLFYFILNYLLWFTNYVKKKWIYWDLPFVVRASKHGQETLFEIDDSQPFAN